MRYTPIPMERHHLMGGFLQCARNELVSMSVHAARFRPRSTFKAPIKRICRAQIHLDRLRSYLDSLMFIDQKDASTRVYYGQRDCPERQQWHAANRQYFPDPAEVIRVADRLKAIREEFERLVMNIPIYGPAKFVDHINKACRVVHLNLSDAEYELRQLSEG